MTVRQRALHLPDAAGAHALADMSEQPQITPTAMLAEALLTADDVAALLAIPRSSVHEYASGRVVDHGPVRQRR